jgi:transcriptional regulator
MGQPVAAAPSPSDLLPGTLDLLILRALVTERMHGYGIAQRLKAISRDVLQVGESSLYPALQRLLLNGYVKAEWGTSENNRRARFYTLTASGRKRLATEREEFQRIVRAIQLVLELA